MTDNDIKELTKYLENLDLPENIQKIYKKLDITCSLIELQENFEKERTALMLKLQNKED